MIPTLDTPHIRRGLRYLVWVALLALGLWAIEAPLLVISVVVVGFLGIILAGMASGLYYGDAEGA